MNILPTIPSNSYPTYKDFPSSGPPIARISELLSSNEPPSSSERNNLTQIVHTAPSTLGDLDSQISYLQNQRNEIASYLGDARTILHPIRLTPDDVLFHIFDYVQVNDLGDSTNTSTGLWPSSQVCRQWRGILLRNAQFWSNIRIGLRTLNRAQISRTMFRLAVILNRVHGQDLHVELQSTMPVRGQQQEMLLSMLLPSAPYWKSLAVSMLYADFVCLDSAQGLFSNLEELNVQILPGEGATPFGAPPGQHIPLEMFAIAPRLRQFVAYADGKTMFYPPDLFVAPWDQITRYIVPEGLQAHSLQLLPRDFSSVTHLSLLGCRGDSSLHWASVPIVTFPRVTHLALGEVSNRDTALRTMFEHIVVPQLRFLKLVYEEKTKTNGENHRVHFPSLKDCVFLEDLEVQADLTSPSNLREEEFLSFFTSAPSSLGVLKLRIRSLPIRLLELFKISSLVPQLSHFDVRGTTAANPYMCILEICEARKGMLKGLRANVQLHFSSANDAAERWKWLREEGLEFRYGPRLDPFQFDGKKRMFDQW